VVELERWLRERVPGAVTPGLAVARFTREAVEWRWVEGLDSQSRFRWFSITKVVTATAVMQLVEDGRLELAAPVKRWLPWVDVRPAAAAPTVEELLSHSSGLPNPLPLGWVHPPGTPIRRGEELARGYFTRPLRLAWAPGTRAHYSNLGFLVLEALVEAASGERFDAFVTRRQLAALGLSSTSFSEVPAVPGHERVRSLRTLGLALVIPSVRRLVAGTHAGFVALRPFVLDGLGYGGLCGTIDDLARLGRAHLCDGAGLLSPESSRRMRTPGPFGFGLAWFVGRDAAGEPYVEHEGSAGGFRASLRLYPRSGVGVAVLANAGAVPVGEVAEAVRRG
jgi:CubicO group peptidase (beta-lactamase class C family)